MDGFWLTLNILGGLGVFLFGMKVMSEGLQKLAGTKLRSILSAATNNRFSATLSGFLVCCAVQSSSATTVMIVSFCSAGLLTLKQSLGMIFGANIGTTTTGWIISLLGFKVKITAFALPIIGIGFFSQFIRRWRWPHRVGEVLVGFGILFLGLSLIKEGIPNVKEASWVQDMLTSFSPEFFMSRLMIVLVGTVLTMIFQSSSAMMAVTLAAAATGLIDYQTSAALVLGENIGTTLTANIAAIGQPLTAKQAARGHLIFNIFGVVWVMILFTPFLKLIDMIVPGDPYGTSSSALQVAIPTHIAAFHTVFNISNTLLVLPFIRKMEKMIVWMVKDKSKEEPVLQYLSTPISATPELAVTAAQKEVNQMAQIVLNMLKKCSEVFRQDGKKDSAKIEEILKDEKKTDLYEHKINEYLSDLTHAHLSTASNKKVLSFMSMINDLERMGDHGEKLAKLTQRAADVNLEFSDHGKKDLNRMTEKTIEIVDSMIASMQNGDKDPIPQALEKERELNKLRNEIRDAHITRISEKKCSAPAGIIFSDMITSLEKMGDHAFNVVEATVGIK